MDAATAKTLSRQNSSDAEMSSPPMICKSCGKVCTNLKEISELSPSSEENKITYSETYLKSETQSEDVTNRCTCNSSNTATAMDSEDIKIIVHEVLDSIVDQVANLANSQVQQQVGKSYKDSEGTPVILQDSVANRDIHSVSPTSEDSGIGCPLSHMEDTKGEVLDFAIRSGNRHEHLHVNDSATSEASKDSARVAHDESQSSPAKEQSMFAALSNNVKYWLGQGSYGKSGKSYCLVL